ncbi:MAG: DNA repair ATPase [Planctomycetaceae bacterium]
MESGTYEILRNRLKGHGDELRKRLGTLNAARKDVFGSIDLKLLSTERITTENNCVPRDMVSIGNRFLFGYNVQFGLKVERSIADVFAVYEFARNDESTQAHGLQPVGLDLLNDAQFQKDFQDVYRYYKPRRLQSSSCGASICTWFFRSGKLDRHQELQVADRGRLASLSRQSQ